MGLSNFISKLSLTKFRYFWAVLLGLSCFSIICMLFGFEVPQGNRDAIMVGIGVFFSNFGGANQHIMKTTDKEHKEKTDGNK
jgi:hypothetical protein